MAAEEMDRQLGENGLSWEKWNPHDCYAILMTKLEKKGYNKFHYILIS